MVCCRESGTRSRHVKTHRGDPARGGHGSNGAARLPQGVPDHYDKGGFERDEIGGRGEMWWY